MPQLICCVFMRKRSSSVSISAKICKLNKSIRKHGAHSICIKYNKAITKKLTGRMRWHSYCKTHSRRTCSSLISKSHHRPPRSSPLCHIPGKRRHHSDSDHNQETRGWSDTRNNTSGRRYKWPNGSHHWKPERHGAGWTNQERLGRTGRDESIFTNSSTSTSLGDLVLIALRHLSVFLKARSQIVIDHRASYTFP